MSKVLAALYCSFVVIAAGTRFDFNTKLSPVKQTSKKLALSKQKDSDINFIENAKPSQTLNVSTWKSHGVLTKKNLIKWLLSFPGVDTINSNWFAYKMSDTIAKYYETGHHTYYLFYYNLHFKNLDGETNFICEIDSNGTFLKKIPVQQTMYSCIPNNFDGFDKIGDFYTYIEGATGSAYCSEHIFFFKTLDKISKDIHGSCFSGFYDEVNNLVWRTEAKIKISQNTLQMLYDQKIEKDKDNKLIVVRRRKKTLLYDWKDENWVPRDSSLLLKLNNPF